MIDAAIRRLQSKLDDPSDWLGSDNVDGRCDDDEDVGLLIAEFERLQAIVDKLPKTADGVPVVPGMRLYDVWTPVVAGNACRTRYCEGVVEWDAYVEMTWKMSGGTPRSQDLAISGCYSTREAAEAAESEAAIDAAAQAATEAAKGTDTT